MDTKQLSAARWREVVFLGDFFRLPPVRPRSTTNAEMHWHYFAESFFHLCRLPAVQGTGLPVRLVRHDDQARQEVRRFYARSLGSAAAPDQDDWLGLCRQGVTEAACAFARRRILANARHDGDVLVAGYDLSTFTTSVLTACGMDWVNAHIHPASFLPDLVFAFSTSVPEIARTLARNSLEDADIQRCADWQKARYAPNAFLNYVPENALLVLAQDWMDPLPLTADNQCDSFSRHAQALRELAKQHSLVLTHVNRKGPYAPGPGLSAQDDAFLRQELNAAMLPAPHIFLKNTVMLLSHPSISTVAGLNSKRLDEARWFGKNVVQLTPSPVVFSPGPPAAPGAQRALTPAHTCLSAAFWASLVAGKAARQDAPAQAASRPLPNVRLIFRGGGSDFDDMDSSSVAAGLAQAHGETALARQDLLLHGLRHVFEQEQPAGPLPIAAARQKDYALFCAGDENYLCPAIVALESTRRRTGHADAFFVTDARRLSGAGQALLRKYHIAVLHSGDGNGFAIRHLHTTPEAYVQLFAPELLYGRGYAFSLGLHADIVCVRPFRPEAIFDRTRCIAACAVNPAARCYSVTEHHKGIEKDLGLTPRNWLKPMNNPGVLFANNAALAEMQFSRQCAKVYAQTGPEFLLCNEETLLNFFCMLDNSFCLPLDDRFNMFDGSVLSDQIPFFLHYINYKPWRFSPFTARRSDLMNRLGPLIPIWHREAKAILDEHDYNTFIAASGE